MCAILKKSKKRKISAASREPLGIQEKMEAKRTAILEAALLLFAEKGFDATPVNELADKAGVAAGTIYRYFADKEALVNGLYLFWKQRFLKAMQEGFPTDATVREQFRWFWYALVQFQRSNAEAFSFLEMHYHSPYLNTASLAIEEEVVNIFRQFILLGQGQGVVKKLLPDLMIALVFGAFTNMIKQQAGGKLEITDKILSDAEAACWDLVTVQTN